MVIIYKYLNNNKYIFYILINKYISINKSSIIYITNITIIKIIRIIIISIKSTKSYFFIFLFIFLFFFLNQNFEV